MSILINPLVRITSNNGLNVLEYESRFFEVKIFTASDFLWTYQITYPQSDHRIPTEMLERYMEFNNEYWVIQEHRFENYHSALVRCIIIISTFEEKIIKFIKRK